MFVLLHCYLHYRTWYPRARLVVVLRPIQGFTNESSRVSDCPKLGVSESLDLPKQSVVEFSFSLTPHTKPPSSIPSCLYFF